MHLPFRNTAIDLFTKSRHEGCGITDPFPKTSWKPLQIQNWRCELHLLNATDLCISKSGVAVNKVVLWFRFPGTDDTARAWLDLIVRRSYGTIRLLGKNSPTRALARNASCKFPGADSGFSCFPSSSKSYFYNVKACYFTTARGVQTADIEFSWKSYSWDELAKLKVGGSFWPGWLTCPRVL